MIKQKDNEVAIVVEKNITPIVSEALGLKITNVEDMKKGVELLSILNKWNDKIVEEKEKITKPLNEALKVERARWKPAETMYEKGIAWIRGEMSRYQMEAIKKQKEEEKKIADALVSGKIKKVETAVRKLNEVTVVDKEVASEEGLVQFAEQKTLKITDPMAIPRMYLIVDEKKILEDLKAGKKIDGAEIEIVLVPRNYR